MNIEHHQWHSPALEREMALKVYGGRGKPVIVFPTSEGRYFDYETYGMVDACAPYIREGKITLYTVDSVDADAWLDPSLSPLERTARHDAYERYILDEVLPFAGERNPGFGRFMATGCSMGGFHAANFLFRCPDRFDAFIALSAFYGPRYLVGDQMDDHLYFYFPLTYLPNLEEPVYLDQYRKSKIVICAGRGPGETTDQYDCTGDAIRLKEILTAKDIPCWAEIWGDDVGHDWSWWTIQMRYFLDHLNW